MISSRIILYCLALAAKHCVKSVQIRNYFWSLFSYILTGYGDLRSKLKVLIKMLQMSFLKMLETKKPDEKIVIILLDEMKIQEDLL